MSLTTASVLAFERKLDPSDALFRAGNWDDRARSSSWPAITIREKSVRGTISNRLKGGKDSDPLKLDAQIEKPNLQTVDVASLPADCDTLAATFTLRVLAGAGTPSACNRLEYQAKLEHLVATYRDGPGQAFAVLAARYAANLANGRFLWRNRVGAEAVEVTVTHLERGQEKQRWVFNALDHSLRRFEEAPQADLKALAELIAQGLSGKGHVLLQVTAHARIGAGQEVFPSQELLLDRGSGKGDKSKHLYRVGDIAGMHSQKIGNALRCIDTWHAGADDFGPIPVEPYGSVTAVGKAFRQPKEKLDFYTLLDGWMLKDREPELPQQHYLMAVLIRGGVFGDSEKEKPGKEA